ncbi:hypothetical protein CIT26_05550 [Mesorhizobium temperatum]|uniref:Uncharacterized protein n=1 Tax=Mesorhizobium temperatum TaxID=241416 RepID=A0A271LUI6_9HYPH|nr:hypothetical protein CIT26_05550 [Mesorhizobium temperatum]
MRGVPTWHQQRSGQHPSTVLALRANPPSPTKRALHGGRRKKAPSVSSGVELEQHDVAVLDDIFLAFVARLAGLLGRHFAA